MNQQLTPAMRQQLKQHGKVTCTTGCGAIYREDRRYVSAPMVRTLTCMYRFDYYNRDQWVKVEDYVKLLYPKRKRDGDFHKMRWWGLIQKFEGQRVDGSPRNGFYKITESGRQFLFGAPIWKYVYYYRDTFHGFSDGTSGRPREVVIVDDCLSKEFSYAELMSSTGRRA